ncbi:MULTISPECIES: tetratricopeptide repeat protein [Sulfitobacter]|jgi:tetratricopeptide (TPR) repeat protein|uniref:tetratricopeptide repeat protein n=1 Tax=Sulfitobacter TaxID=60136 RepID=UPI0004E456E9|nr:MULTISPECIES: tetratricopeptide repeat protein [Sulfitobacter]MAX77803.1 hypothetical protein [Roseobacter sp.]PTA99481.1 hypothetical protein C8254_13690 [Sulfitobacter sp. CB-A]ULO21366.1 tetratricopeptide repeat protein [Sulfitobacter sp. CB2047]BDY16470.1 hypothetical protein Sulfitobl28_24400 [Sulfitobacter pontiacus]HAR83360.1 hypothetical protein [Sulfitobacter pontiacus]|tara:strand:+ start:315 stop:839 length:525 start_codon:yes stop_codon:yes gene_type:complete
MRVVFASILSLAMPFAAFAAGSNDTSPPKPVVKCEDGQVYDKKSKTCIDAKDSRLTPDDLYQTVRELAYAGEYSDAQIVLAAMPEHDDRRLTYMGFTTRKMGDQAGGMAFYARALAANPANVLARSYRGQALVEQGDIPEALAELRAIRAHGGAGTWAETSLRTAIATGQTFSY